jgi:hypothetical protein
VAAGSAGAVLDGVAATVVVVEVPSAAIVVTCWI